jgi:hypothetical protein
VITLYLLPALNVKLLPKMLKELKPGTRIVSHAFAMGDWKPEKTLEHRRAIRFTSGQFPQKAPLHTPPHRLRPARGPWATSRTEARIALVGVV